MEYLIVGITSYLMGSIPFGFILTKIFLKKDIREIGSGNIGATNALRTGNKLVGYSTLILDIVKAIIPVISDELVVSNIGLPSQELHMLDDQPTNFYMLGTMGLASSIGLGLALSQNETVIAIDGDGSVLTNFGTLPTIANNVANNFILLIIDNGSYGSTGDQPTYAGGKTSLAKVAEACGCDNVIECQASETRDVLEAAIQGKKMTIIVSKCESGNIPVPVIDIDPAVIRHRFMEEVKARN